MISKNNWEETKERFIAWWKGKDMDRPMLKLVARKKDVHVLNNDEIVFDTLEEMHMGVEKKIIKAKKHFNNHYFLAEAFPSFDLNIGPGSMATYLGSEPVFNWNTVWYKEIVNEGWKKFDSLVYDPENYWWKKHLNAIQNAVLKSKGEFYVNIPDIIENVDILSAIRGPQDFCYDLMDVPDLVKDYVNQVDGLYFKYYDAFYDVVKDSAGGSSYTSFSIWGPGKTAKVQCDFSAMMSPDQFGEFVKLSLEKQCNTLDYSLYHLDGPDCIRHLDTLMEIKNLNALQWTPGTGSPDAANEIWYHVYDKVKEAGKSLWVLIKDGNIENWIDSAIRMIKRYGNNGLYLLFPIMEEEEAQRVFKAILHYCQYY